MAFVMDRALQRELLEAMREVFPKRLPGFPTPSDHLTPEVVAQLYYLHEHGLCDALTPVVYTNQEAIQQPKITARGLDFLADDGGLSAILGVVTVKLHADTVRDLIAAKIEASGLPAEKKAGLLAGLKKLPEAALQEGAKGLMRAGINNVGDIEAWLHGLPRLLGL